MLVTVWGNVITPGLLLASTEELLITLKLIQSKKAFERIAVMPFGNVTSLRLAQFANKLSEISFNPSGKINFPLIWLPFESFIGLPLSSTAAPPNLVQFAKHPVPIVPQFDGNIAVCKL